MIRSSHTQSNIRSGRGCGTQAQSPAVLPAPVILPSRIQVADETVLPGKGAIQGKIQPVPDDGSTKICAHGSHPAASTFQDNLRVWIIALPSSRHIDDPCLGIASIKGRLGTPQNLHLIHPRHVCVKPLRPQHGHAIDGKQRGG